MKKAKKLILILSILFSVTGCDRATKMMAMNQLSNSSPISFFGNTIVLQHVENTGAFLSFGSELSENMRFLMFILLPIFVLAVMLIHLLVSSKHDIYQIVGFSLIIGGGFGNLYDRVFRYGHVIDFMNVGIGPIRTGIFNFADVAILIGFLMLLYPILVKRLNRHESNLYRDRE